MNSYLVFEEDIIKKLSNFYLALGWKNEVSNDSCELIENGLATLKNDTDKHIRIVSEVIGYIEGSKNNEF